MDPYGNPWQTNGDQRFNPAQSSISGAPYTMPSMSANTSAQVAPPNPEGSRGFWGGLWSLWLRITGPNFGDVTHDPGKRELLRRSRLLSVMHLIVFVVVIAIFPTGFVPSFNQGTFETLGICILMLIVSVSLNRANQVNAAGIAYCFGVEVAIAWALFRTPDGLGFKDLPTFGLFALPIVIAGMLLPRRWSLIFWVIGSAFTVLDMLLEHHQGDLQGYINSLGNIYPTIDLSIILAFVIAIVSFLSAGSVENAIFKSDRTSDLEHAYGMMAEQNESLETAISIIEDVHARVAAGDLSARAPVGAGELMGLSASLNIMLDRIARLRTAESTLTSVENASRVLAQYAWELGAGNYHFAPPQTGMPTLDIIGTALDQMRRSVANEVTALTTALAGMSHSGEELMAANRALNAQSQETARRLSALNDFIQSMRVMAERAEASLIPPTDWLQQASDRGWSDGAALATTVAEGLSQVRQVIAMADQSPSGQFAQDSSRSEVRELFLRAGAAERGFMESLTASRTLLGRLNNPTNALGAPKSMPQ